MASVRLTFASNSLSHNSKQVTAAGLDADVKVDVAESDSDADVDVDADVDPSKEAMDRFSNPSAIRESSVDTSPLLRSVVSKGLVVASWCSIVTDRMSNCYDKKASRCFLIGLVWFLSTTSTMECASQIHPSVEKI